MSSDFIDTSDFWAGVADLPYVLVRQSPHFPRVPANGDIDILTIDPDGFARRVMTHWPQQGLEVGVRALAPDHIQLDLVRDKLRLAMFDVYSHESICAKSPISPGFAVWALGRRRATEVNHVAIWVPSKVDDAVFRYGEYTAAFWTGREKDWHLEWITNHLTEDEFHEFLMLVHYFAKNPRLAMPDPRRKVQHSRTLLRIGSRDILPFVLRAANSALPSKIVERLKATRVAKKIVARLG